MLLWTEPQTRLANMPMRGAWNRKMAGMPLVMVEGRGPGHLALSDNHAGEVVALPMQHSQQIWVREHRFLCATGNIKYDWYPSDVWYETGQDCDDREMHYPMGQYGDVFGAQGAPGLLLLHAPGNTFIRDLQQGQTLLIQPSALLYRDVTVRMALHLEYPRNMGLVLLAQPVELPQHLGPAVGSRPGRGAVGLPAARGHRGHPPPLLRDDAPLVAAGRSRRQRRPGVERGHVRQRGRPVGLVKRGQLGRAQHVLDPVEAAGRPRAHRLQQPVGGHVAAGQHDGVDAGWRCCLVGGQPIGRAAG